MRVVALILALLITTIASIDPLCCADGCTGTNLSATNHPSPSDGACPICQPGAVATMPIVATTGLEPGSTTLPVDQLPLEAILRAIEHPPRP